MNRTGHKSTRSDELDLFEIAEFIYAGWKTILFLAVAGGIFGLCVAILLPEKFAASAKIDGGKVIEKTIEPIAILADKMRTPSFYSTNTVTACLDDAVADEAQSVVRMLAPTVPRDSDFVNITAKMKSKDAARGCLIAVLDDVRSNQKVMFEAIRSSSIRELDQLESELHKNELLRSEEMSIDQSQLEEAQRELAKVESFLQEFQLSSNKDFDVKDEKFSASTLLVSVVSMKRDQAFALKDRILTTESRIQLKIGSPSTEKAIADLKSKINLLRVQLESPITREAVFAVPIYNPEERVEPRRTFIVAGGIICGCFAGMLMLFLRRFFSEFKMRRMPNGQF